MTVRAMELLKSVDVVLYDRLVAKKIISQIPATTEKCYVGRAVGDSTFHQDETNKLMLEHAHKGKNILRLKGGDPFVFGRGAEEAEFLRQHGIEFEIVPGVTSAIASPAYAGIPVTERHFSSSVAIVTGHEEEGKRAMAVEWKKLASAVDTIVILMGISQLGSICCSLRDGGISDDVPVAIIEKGTTGEQRVLIGTIGNIEKTAVRAKIQPPAVIVVGRVVTMNSKISWFKGERKNGRQPKK
jgi:uroporphyrin-III C-methyltransferase